MCRRTCVYQRKAEQQLVQSYYERRSQDERVQKRTAIAVCVASANDQAELMNTTQWYVDPTRRARGNRSLEEINATQKKGDAL